ncbi:hypothetical protein B0T26DRAFT_637976 [Lasiosphaeria miniovina]|uniref:Cell surface protein n=1 Tax=Lasiosphaeria miniovina TaxID=1954250 RepID=A0AA40B6R5_9PEZI|nr:uncharacterized protein B0T26DRAFT_637976 [Lasiosphaeria miniovina]KAK0728716.1 hypothetical protein B0T26DRAFT_637976 [Lasiosphaeria miniovina]
MSGIVNKIKEAVHSDKSHSAPEGTQGPHNSRVANAADPRVDSDRDGSRNMGAARTAGHGEFGSSAAYSGSSGMTSGTTGYNTGATEGSHGPHSSRLANAADPRVDSDRDGSRTVSGTGNAFSPNTGRGEFNTGSTFGATEGSARHAGHGKFGSGNTFDTSGTVEGARGPHNSRIANAMDPRVDSDRDGSRTVGGTGSNYNSPNTGSTFSPNTGGNTFSPNTGSSTFNPSHNAGSGVTGMAGTHGQPTGTHSSRFASAADPRIDFDHDGRAGVGSSAPGPAPNTAGPHKSDMMNKMDPRVDSDLDGSKTVGGNNTYQSGTRYLNKDPTDAAQVPPSVLQRHIGGPLIAHNDTRHHRERRNSVKTHQETFSGI